MPGVILSEVDHFVPVAPSKEPIDFVDLHKVDLSTYDNGLEARRELAEQVRLAMTTQGFFTLLITASRRKRSNDRSISDTPFSSVRLKKRKSGCELRSGKKATTLVLSQGVSGV